jgi:phosphatidyl-myo-inositol dimannoside synthase
MRLAIVSYGFHQENIRLQPWRYVYEIAKLLPGFGVQTTILTDQKNAAQPGDVQVIDNVAISPAASTRLLRTIGALSPDAVLWPLGPRSLAFLPFLLRLPARVVGYLPGPILRWADFRAAWEAGLMEWREAAAWLFAGQLGWGKAMSRCCTAFVVMSQWNAQRLMDMGIAKDRVHLITAGRDHMPASYDTEAPNPILMERKNGKIGLFMGWPIRVRGLELLLDSFAIARRQSPNLRLVILARGQGTPDHEELRLRVASHPNVAHIQVIEGFLPPKEVQQHIAACDFGVLPFIVVPADRPITFLEFFAGGKPVIATDAAGLPELLEEGRGLVTKRNPNNLAEALIVFTNESKDRKEARRRACIDFISHYPDWNASAQRFFEMLSH